MDCTDLAYSTVTGNDTLNSISITRAAGCGDAEEHTFRDWVVGAAIVGGLDAR